MVNYEELVKKEQHNSPGGIDAIFIPISDKWALKMFSCEDKRNSSYSIQKRCSEYDLAPRVGEKIDIVDGDYPYGFICEIVDTVVSHEIIKKINKWRDNDESWDDDVLDEWNELEWETEEELGELINNYESLGYWPSDMHVGNLGYMMVDGERKLICIDFGHW